MTFLTNTVALAATPSPDWSEFCPIKYLNAEYQENNYSYGANVLLGLTIIGLPFVIHTGSKSLRLDTSNYWVSRHKAFENEIATCKSDPNNQAQCFMQVWQIEENKTFQNKYIKLLEQSNKNQNYDALQQRLQLNKVNTNLRNINDNVNNLNRY